MEQIGKMLGAPAAANGPDPGQPPREYQPPRLRRLGTLAELTQSGPVGFNDGEGGTGFS